MLLNFYVCHDFLHRLLRRVIIISVQVYFFICTFCFSLQTFATQVAAYYFYKFLLLYYFLRSHYISLYTQQHQTRHANNHNESVTLLLTQNYKPLSIKLYMTPSRFDLERYAFRVCLKFQGHKLTYNHSPVVKLRNTSQII